MVLPYLGKLSDAIEEPWHWILCRSKLQAQLAQHWKGCQCAPEVVYLLGGGRLNLQISQVQLLHQHLRIQNWTAAETCKGMSCQVGGGCFFSDSLQGNVQTCLLVLVISALQCCVLQA